MSELNLEIEALKTKLFEARVELEEARDDLRNRADDLDEQWQETNKLREEAEAVGSANAKLRDQVSQLRHESSLAHEQAERLGGENQALKAALAAAQKRIHLQESALTAVGLVLKGFLGTHQQEQG